MKKPVAIFAILCSTLCFMGCNKATAVDKDGKPAPLSPEVVEQKMQTAGQPAAAQPAAEVPPVKPADPNEVLISVGDAKLVRKDLDAQVNALIKAQNVPAEQIQMAKNYFEQNLARQFVVRTVLMQKATEDQITITDEEKKKRVDEINEQLKKSNTTLEEQLAKSPFGKETAQKEFDDGMLLDKLLKVAVVDKIEVKPEEVKKEIDAIKANNAKVEEENKNLDAKKGEAKKKIEGLKKQIADGADFAKLAKEHSDCPSKEKGGDLGEFQRGQMVKEFEEAAFTQPIGKVGEIVETKFGYHLILVTAKNPAVEAKDGKPAKPETVKASHILVKTPEAQQPRPVPSEKEMMEMLKNRQAQQSIQTYIQDLIKKAKIENKAFPDMKF